MSSSSLAVAEAAAVVVVGVVGGAMYLGRVKRRLFGGARPELVVAVDWRVVGLGTIRAEASSYDGRRERGS